MFYANYAECLFVSNIPIYPPFIYRTYYYTIRKKHTLKPIENYIIELHVYVFLTIKCHIKEIAYKHIIANHHSLLLKIRLVYVKFVIHVKNTILIKLRTNNHLKLYKHTCFTNFDKLKFINDVN